MIEPTKVITPTIKNLLNETSFKNDITRLDIEILLSFVLKKPRIFLITYSETKLSQIQYKNFQHLLKRKNAGEPVAYLIGKQAFWSLTFKVDENVLIPRSDTEVLVQKSLQLIDENHYQTVLDLGTGSGAIALSIGFERPNIKIVAVDNSDKALAVAVQNTNRFNINNVVFIKSDWFTKITDKFDLIVSNPPYIADNDPHLSALKFEPQSALVSGKQGLDDIKHIIKNADFYLNDGGCVLVEHGFDQAQKTQEIFNENGFLNIGGCQDLANLDRITFGFSKTQNSS